jgi:hypothetical protein
VEEEEEEEQQQQQEQEEEELRGFFSISTHNFLRN